MNRQQRRQLGRTVTARGCAECGYEVTGFGEVDAAIDEFMVNNPWPEMVTVLRQVRATYGPNMIVLACPRCGCVRPIMLNGSIH